MAESEAQPLPADFYHLLSQELAQRLDFGTLYNCIVSSKLIANSGAINALYRISHECPVKDGGEAYYMADQQVITMKWSIMWRTIILSALGKTMYPYCRHLRMLDLRNLKDLLEQLDDTRFKGKIQKSFFAGDLAQFRILLSRQVKGGAGRLDYKKIVLAIGEEITQHAPLIEALSEPSNLDMLSGVLNTWSSRLSHLRELELWDGKALADESVRTLLHTGCPKLDRLGLYFSTDSESDQNLAAFISGMPENSLVRFENMSTSRIGAQTFLALNHHGKSLRHLKMDLSDEGILALGFLRGCTNLESIALSSSRHTTDLKATNNDVFLEIVGWLKSCHSLQDISLSEIISAPDLLFPVLLTSEIKLHGLQINAKESTMYTVKDHHDFHEALSAQPTLRALYLSADPDPLESRDDVDTLINAFCSLPDLRELKLTRISDYFSDDHLNNLARSLPHLEELSVGGYGITDNVFSSVATLRNLKNLTFSGITTFTTDGLLAFIDQLGEGNQLMSLSVDMADPESMLPQESQDLVRAALVSKLDGRFEYQPLRDPNIPEFDQSDSD